MELTHDKMNDFLKQQKIPISIAKTITADPLKSIPYTYSPESCEHRELNTYSYYKLEEKCPDKMTTERKLMNFRYHQRKKSNCFSLQNQDAYFNSKNHYYS